jgi:hypothetical protein
MKQILLVTFFFIQGLLKAQDCKVENTSFQTGERVDYTIYYHLAGVWVGAGDVYFEVDSQRIGKSDYFHLNSYGKTYKKYDWIYKVRDSYEAFVKQSTLQPIRFKREVREGNTFIKEDYIFKQKSNEVITLRQLDEDKPLVKDTVATKPCSYDVLTMIYYARNMDFTGVKIGEKVPIRIFLDNESHESYIRYMGKKQLKIKDLGTFNCIVISPYLIEGTIFNGGEDMTVWVTDDKNRVPMLIETPILVGSIKARVNNMEGLRHPLKSKVE